MDSLCLARLPTLTILDGKYGVHFRLNTSAIFQTGFLRCDRGRYLENVAKESVT
jgi:hypothetical protein